MPSLTSPAPQAELIVGDQSGAIHIWDLKTDHNEQLIPEPEVSITSAHIDPDASYMAAVNSTVSAGCACGVGGPLSTWPLIFLIACMRLVPQTLLRLNPPRPASSSWAPAPASKARKRGVVPDAHSHYCLAQPAGITPTSRTSQVCLLPSPPRLLLAQVCLLSLYHGCSLPVATLPPH